MTRHMFAGGNTPNGFHSFFDNILPVEKARRRIFLKGASGSGKSTFMKKLAAAMEMKMLDLDYFHCSNDINSLDAISSGNGICVIDGTAPHICDPEIPAAIDDTLNFAEFINESSIAPFAGEIKDILRRKRPLVDTAYMYFDAAAKIYFINKTIYQSVLLRPTLRRFINDYKALVNGSGETYAAGKNRRLFASAVTPDGLKDYADTILGGYTVYGLYAETGMGAEEFINELRKVANDSGLDTECFYCPLEPSKPDHLIVPELGLAFTTVNKRHSVVKMIDIKIDLMECIDLNKFNSLKSEVEYNDMLVNGLLDKAVEGLKGARNLHDRIEKIYIGSMDFSNLDKLTEQTIAKLLS